MSCFLALSALLVAVVGIPGATLAQAAPVGGAAIALDRTSVQLGQRLLVTLSGWRSTNVMLSVCGNLAARGSGDCNLTASQALKLVNNPTITQLTIFAPPGTCPCVIRASSAAQDEVAVAPIDIAGVPVGPVVGPVVSAPIAVSLIVSAAHVGLLDGVRAALGGPTAYEVTVSVHNLTAAPITEVTLAGSVGHAQNDIVASFDVPPPGAIAARRTWAQRVRVTLPAPVINRFVWQVIASGVGVPTTATAVTHRVPVGFVILAIILVVDVLGMVWYFTARHIRRRRRDPQVPPGTPSPAPLYAAAR